MAGTPGGDGAFSYQFGPADTVRQDLANTQTALVKTINDLETYSTKHLEFWTSEARDTYDRVQREWHTTVTEMTDILNKLHIGLGDIHDNFVITENKATGLW